MIILGYPGIGKTTYANSHDFAIDLDYDRIELYHYYENMYNIYYMSLDTARLLSDQGYTVFLPWSKVLQQMIINNKDRLDRGYYIIYPSKTSDIDYIRYAPDSIFTKVELTNMDYDLEKIIDGLNVMQEIWGELEGTGKNVSENRNENT